ncbi:MAG: hypothetical protein ABW250_13505 [Pyrinomonadaceae bacterium]
MEKPESVRRHLVKMTAFSEHVVAEFAFGADFRSTALTLTVNLSVHANKATSFQDIERMADQVFLDLLKATLAKGSEEISS